MMNSELNRAIAQMIRLCPDAHIIQAELKKRVEVVRCGECKHKVEIEEILLCGYSMHKGKTVDVFAPPTYYFTKVEPDHFCSYGVRREK